jgi:hypothetical protein
MTIRLNHQAITQEDLLPAEPFKIGFCGGAFASGGETIYNVPMSRRIIFRLSAVVAMLVLVLSSLSAGAQQKASNRGRKFKAPPPTARIEVTVLRDFNGKPIENAAVIFHGTHDKSNMELKTNEDGKAIIDVLPIGEPVRLQIIARGFQTFGDDYAVDKPAFSIEIRMKRPGEQYSIYKDHPDTLRGGKGADAAKPASPEGDKSAPDPASKDKPAAQPDQQPSPSQQK